MLCSKLHCQKFSKLEHILYKITREVSPASPRDAQGRSAGKLTTADDDHFWRSGKWNRPVGRCLTRLWELILCPPTVCGQQAGWAMSRAFVGLVGSGLGLGVRG